MTTKASKAQATSAARLAEMLAKCAPVWVPAEDQGHIRALAVRDASYAREDAIRAPHAEWEA